MSVDPVMRGSRATVEMPAPTVAPLVLALAIALVAAGVATSYAIAAVGGILFVVGLGRWIVCLLPGEGHEAERLAESAAPVHAEPGGVARLREGMPGYRLRLPIKVHPISSGIKGGLVGGVAMIVPAAAYCLVSGHSIWLPLNLLAGMALPGVGEMTTAELEQFNLTLFVWGVVIHVTVSLTLGLLYGVLMPTLPQIKKPLAWGALLMPLFWTAVNFVAVGFVNPMVRARIEWPWFIVSQLIFGIVAAVVYMSFEHRNRIAAGMLAGVAGGLVMPLPAVLWGWLSGHGVWYPVNLLAALVMRHASELPTLELEQFHAEWFWGGIAVHAGLSLLFGLAFAFVLPRLPDIPASLAWGAMVLPLLWTAASYGLMGVVNPALQQLVEWPSFIAAQFVFGIVAAIVVVRSEQIPIAPAGPGPRTAPENLC